MISDWWICVIPVVLGVLALMYFAQQSYKPGTYPPVILDATGPHRRDKEKIIEAGCIVEQRRHGYELGGPVTLIISEEPTDYSAQLNLRSVRKKGADVDVKVVKK